MKLKLLLAILIPTLVLGNLNAATLIYDGSQYFKQADSPFYEGILAGTIAIDIGEDEGRSFLRLPNVDVPNISVSGNFRSGVDEDDGVLDGIGRSNSFFSFDPTFSFQLTPNNAGDYPRYLGAVMISNMVSSTGRLLVTAVDGSTSFFEFNGPLWREFTGLPRTLSPGSHGIFWGIYEPKGILRAEFDGSDKLDHIQIGFAIPEPSVGLLALGVLSLGGLDRRRRTRGLSASCARRRLAGDVYPEEAPIA
jgi:hypothetical protein